MASVNKVILVGNLGADPETRFMPDGNAVANATLATSESWKDKTTGEKKESTEWHRLVFRNKLAEIVGQYLKKGASIYVEGRIRTRKWTDKEGQERYTTEIDVREMTMLGGKPASEAPQRSEPQRSAQGAQPDYTGMAGDDDIPFRQHGAGKMWRVI